MECKLESSSGAESQASFVDMMLSEAECLALEARSLHLAQPADPQGGSGPDFRRLEICRDLTAITSAIGFGVSWLLVRKAIQVGEISSEEALEKKWRLGKAPALTALER